MIFPPTMCSLGIFLNKKLPLLSRGSFVKNATLQEYVVIFDRFCLCGLDSAYARARVLYDRQSF
jgi:hypothetical protein